MPFRDDLAAAHARIAELEAQQKQSGAATNPVVAALVTRRTRIAAALPTRIIIMRIGAFVAALTAWLPTIAFTLDKPSHLAILAPAAGLITLIAVGVLGILGPWLVRRTFTSAIAKLDAEIEVARRGDREQREAREHLATLEREVDILRAQQHVRVDATDNEDEEDERVSPRDVARRERS